MPAVVVFTFAERPNKETVQCPMAEGCVCAYGGGWEEKREETQEECPCSSPFFQDIMESETTGTEESMSQQEGGEGEELQTFSGARHLDVVEATQVSATRPKVRHCFSCSLAWNKHLARSKDRPLAMHSVR